jgi:hypothetical protein
MFKRYKIAIDWFSERTLWSPVALVDSVANRCAFEIKNFNPFGKRASFTIQRNEAATATVAGLLFLRAPFHISWVVALVVLNAVDRVLCRRAWADVVKECLKRCFPLPAYCNPTSAVSLPSWLVWIGAAVNHRPPASPLAGLAAFTCMTVLCLTLQGPATHSLANDAAATSRRAVAKSVSQHRPLGAADASTEHEQRPLLVVGGVVKLADSSPAIKLTTSRNGNCFHAFIVPSYDKYA